MSVIRTFRRRAPLFALLALLLAPGAPVGAGSDPVWSRFLLGAYRKTMLIEDQIAAACQRYGVPMELARAVCMYESGGNDSLTSAAGAHGYFQVMPSTMRLLGVDNNIDGGVKYLGQMIAQFGRQDDALAAYNAGPGRVARGSPMPIETLQYVLGIGYLRTLLVLDEPGLRAQAARLQLHEILPGESWLDISRATGVSLLELRLYNTYQVQRPLRAGHFIAFPRPPAEGSSYAPPLQWSQERSCWVYRTLPGDLYLHLAFSLDVPIERMRDDNALWRVQAPIAGVAFCIRPQGPAPDQPTLPHLVEEGETIETIASARSIDPWALIRDNGLWDQTVVPGQTLLVSPSAPAQLAELPPMGSASPPVVSAAPAPAVPRLSTHKVRRGETLSGIARTYGTTTQDLRELNRLRSSRVKVGQLLKVPRRS